MDFRIFLRIFLFLISKFQNFLDNKLNEINVDVYVSQQIYTHFTNPTSTPSTQVVYALARKNRTVFSQSIILDPKVKALRHFKIEAVYKGIEFFPPTLIFQYLYLCNPMS